MNHYEIALYIVSGAVLSLQLMLGGLTSGIVVGTLLAITRHNGYMVFVINRLISIIRGTPLLLQLSFFYFVAPRVLGFSMSTTTAGIIALGLNSSAYIAEIIRAGIGSVPKGQFEAAKTLQIPSLLMWRDIILPQVGKNIFPALINESISLLKETALIATLGGMDIMRRAQIVAAEQFNYFMPLCIAGICYYSMVVIIETIGKAVEKRAWNGHNH